jgi:acylphosphatase
MTHERVEVYVGGRVQGVFYRASAREEAQRLGVLGEVRNLPDGRVEVIAEGPRDRLEQLVAWCRRGPPAAEVADVAVRWSAATGGYTAFRVAR